MDQQNQLKPVPQHNKVKVKTENSAIKGDYKKWEGDLSYQDLVNHLKLCYNEYNQLGRDISLPRDIRMSYIDRTDAYQAILDYIERQVK